MTVLQSVRTSEGSYSPRSVRQGEVLTADADGILKKWDPYPPVTTQWCLYAPSVAGILADPHISTFDVQHSSQPGHLFTVALLRGGHGPFRRDCRNQEASRRIGKSMPTIQVASPSQKIQRACFSSTTRQNPCGKCSRSLHRTASGRHGKETKSGGSSTR